MMNEETPDQVLRGRDEQVVRAKTVETDRSS